MIHELNAALHNINLFIQECGVDDLENVGMWLVLGIENRDDITRCNLQAQVEMEYWLISGPKI